MPWHLVETPSIQVGTTAAILARAGLPIRAHSFHLALMDFLVRNARSGRDAFTVAEYETLATRWSGLGAGEWLFAHSQLGTAPKASDEEFTTFLREFEVPAVMIRKLRRIRRVIPQFVAECAQEILDAKPSVVGFTTTYAQTVPALALAHAIKERNSEVTILFGGANCEDTMGPAILRGFDQLDVVLRGEAENVLPDLIRALHDEADLAHLPGVCFRKNGDVVASPVGPSKETMDDNPYPTYDEFFARLERSQLSRTIVPRIPYESSRGCWWGMKSHCTFCGLNGGSMNFRRKSPDRVVEEVTSLAARHKVLDFSAVDNILEMDYFDTLLPKLAERAEDLSFFFETKANLTVEKVAALHRAGAHSIQPGIESLSTPILRLMGKGASAMHNLRLLKWCAHFRIHVCWNLLYGFPGEDPAEYARMAELMPSLSHLSPPKLYQVVAVRFSPYFRDPAKHGMRLTGPARFYEMLFDIDPEVLGDLASVFDHEYADGRDPETYVAPVRAAIARWSDEAERNERALTYRRGPGLLTVIDSRTVADGIARYTLDEIEAQAYLACEAGASLSAVLAEVRHRTEHPVAESEIRRMLGDFVDARIACEVDGKFLSLALPGTPAVESPDPTCETSPAFAANS